MTPAVERRQRGRREGAAAVTARRRKGPPPPDPLATWAATIRRVVAEQQMYVCSGMKMAGAARESVIVAGLQAAVALAYKLFPDEELKP